MIIENDRKYVHIYLYKFDNNNVDVIIEQTETNK